MEKKLMLPANYNVMNEEEMTYTSGGDGPCRMKSRQA